MNETTKTLLFALGAVAAIGAAWWGRPARIGSQAPDQIGQVLFENFQDPYDAKSMEVIEFDEDLGTLTTFRVAQKNGLWVIPSHQDYPADAEDNLKTAATMLIDLKVINVVSDDKSAHATYGVKKPDKEETQLGDKGVGKLVSMKDANGRVLAEIVIGEEVKGQDGQRYVRVGDIDQVYTVKIDPSAMSTKFEDWVQRDVLDLNGFDIQEMIIRDYSVNPRIMPNGQITLTDDPRLDLTVNWNADEFKWDLGQLLEYRARQLRPTELLDNEELNKTSLDAMKNALDDLKIVDVERKPAGLGADLKADQGFWKNREGIQSLFEHGFYPMPTDEGTTKLRSSDGEVVVSTKTGVDYVLWFGQIAGLEQSEESKLNRFVMISARLNEDVFEKPELSLPSEEPEEEPAEENSEAESVADDEERVEEGEEDGQALPDEEPQSEEESDAQDDAAAEDKEDEEPDSERDRLIKEYDRKMDEYKEKVKEAKEKVDNLNFRFADWYYVISEDEYKRIHVRRSDVVTEKETAVEEGFGVDAFRKLEAKGLQKDEATE